jgi:vacuolar-type H+-ATPase subunit H
MKIKKALKKLDKAESLLSSIIDEYDTAEEPRLKEALAAAKESLVHAKETVNHATAESKTARKSAGKASADSAHTAESRERRKVRVAAAAGQ